VINELWYIIQMTFYDKVKIRRNTT